ncbi:MAG: TIGR02099 family protein [Betaproteobacteria bacterium]|nr:TIGR02099 family protein [Betaproteobacteria bacterium]
MIAIGLVLAAFVATVKYAVMPNIHGYQPEIVSRVATASGMDVSAKSIRGRWSGFRPWVDMEDVVFLEPPDSKLRPGGQEALRLPYVSASLSWWALAIGQIRFGEITVDAPALALSRGKDGLVYFAGRALNAPKEGPDDGRFLRWLLAQDGLVIRDATLTWNDAQTEAGELTLADVDIAVRKRRNGHELGFRARPPASLATAVELRAAVDLKQDPARWQAAGTVYAEVQDARVDEIRRHVTVPRALIAGRGNVRLWLDFDTAAPTLAVPNEAMRASTPLRAITADLHLAGTRARLGEDLEPLDVAELSGRLEYRAADAGFTMASKGLALRTSAGVKMAPADFSLTLKDQNDAARAGGEMTGDGIDLKVMTALLEFFPVGKDVRHVVNDFSPRGLVQKTRYAWSGPLEAPRGYEFKGTLSGFALNQHDAFPGVSGFSGTVEGSDKRGRFDIDSRDFSLSLPKIYEEPLQFTQLSAKGTWTLDADALRVDVGTLAVAGEQLEGTFSGTWERFRAAGARGKEEKGPGSIDFTGRFARIDARAVGRYLHKDSRAAREYLDWAIRGGEVRDADVILKGTLYDFPFRHGEGGQFRIAGKLANVALRHSEGWPQIGAIQGDVTYENTRFEAKLESAQVLSTRLGRTSVLIEDLGAAPPLLVINGTTAARAEEVTRYIRESPLQASIGGFTQFVTLQGPGKLDLTLKIPLGNNKEHGVPFRFSGQYALNRGRALVAVGDKSAEVTSVSGAVTFSETATRGQAITGTAFGYPAVVSLATNADGGVTTEFAARADMAALSPLLPFRLPQQVTGTIDLGGKIIGRSSGTEIQVVSSLLGAASALPFPLAKRADEPRRLQLTFTQTGQAAEQIHLSLAGNATAQGDAAESRIDAQFRRRVEGAGASGAFRGGVAHVGEPVGARPIPDGLWLGGTLPRLDFDAWRAAVDAFEPPPPAGTPAAEAARKADSPIAGFDFKLDHLVAYGRPFKALTLRGRHAGEDWRMQVESAEAQGDFSWRAGAFNDRGYVRARLARLSIADELPAASPPAPQGKVGGEGDKTDLPAFDIVAERFTLSEKFLGKLEFKATPLGANWRIDQLDISNGHATLNASGLYQRYGDPQKPDGRSRTALDFKLESSNLNALLAQFGYQDQLRGGRGKAEGKLAWPGHAFQFKTANLSGQMHLEATDGQIAKIEPGAGKLLGLLSLQSLGNRLSFDFRDIYDDGLAFRRLGADVAIANGVMSTENFELKGPAAFIQLSGTISLPAETVSMRALVFPLVGEGAALGAIVLVNPAVGAGVWLVSKLFQEALSYELVIMGSWTNPEVAQVKKNLDKAKKDAPPDKGAAPANTAAEPKKTP